MSGNGWASGGSAIRRVVHRAHFPEILAILMSILARKQGRGASHNSINAMHIYVSLFF